MMNCKEAVRLMSLERERALSANERFALRFHTLLCTGCRNYRQQMAFLHAACVERAGGASGDGEQDDA
jgi:hypothetical protein